MPSIKVDGMHCENCKNAVEKAVKAIPGVKDAKADLDAKELHWEEGDQQEPIALNIVLVAIEDFGYKPSVKP